MIRQSTIDKLHDMHLSAMSDAVESQCADSDTYQGLYFEDRFEMLVDKEWDKRKSTKLQKLIRSAEFCYPNACMEAIEYHPDRNLDKGQMLEFSTCRYISDDHHIILKGASGKGKVTRDNVIELLNVTPPQAYRVLKRMKEKGKIKLIGNGRTAYYETIE